MSDIARLRALAFTARLASRCSDALGDALVSVILHGSLTLDDFVPGRSDVDLLVVVEEPLSDEQFAALRDAVNRLCPEASSRVDLRVVTRATAWSPARDPVMEAAFTLRPGKAAAVETRIVEPDRVVDDDSHRSGLFETRERFEQPDAGPDVIRRGAVRPPAIEYTGSRGIRTSQ